MEEIAPKCNSFKGASFGRNRYVFHFNQDTQYVKEGSCWLIGDDNKVNFWKNTWLSRLWVDLLNVSNHLHPLLTATAGDFIHNVFGPFPHFLLYRDPIVVDDDDGSGGGDFYGYLMCLDY